MKSNINTVENMKSISIDKAINTINNALYSFLNNKRLEEKGTIVILPIDHATIESGYLRLKKYNNCEGVSIPLADIDNISLVTDESTPTIHIELINGEGWIVKLDDRETNYSQQIDSYREIDADEFLERLRKCREVRVSHEQEYMSFDATYDMVLIYDSDFDLEYDDNCGVRVVLCNSNRIHANCKLNIGHYATKFHLMCAENDSDDPNVVVISLCDMPLLSKLYLTLSYDED